MKSYYKWLNLALLGLCMVGLSGFVLRSKIVFSMPFINYNHLLEAHAHITFGGWVTLGLLTLMCYEILPAEMHKKPVYQWLLGGVALSAWGMCITYLVNGYANSSIFFTFLFILLTAVFSVFFIRDAVRSKITGSTWLLSAASLTFLFLSAAGTVIIAAIYFTRHFDAFVYRDALFTYLHFQYNGFFTLSIFSLVSNIVSKRLNQEAKQKLNRFAWILTISILPSLFISYLWQDPKIGFWIVALLGSILLLVCCVFFIVLAKSLVPFYQEETPWVRILIGISMGSFLLKTFLQCFTIFPLIGNAIFGNRPVIMGFLHLVFLAFTSLFIIAFITKRGFLDGRLKITKAALIVFSAAILLNEVLLITQGLASMLISGNIFFPWALWFIGIFLFSGTVLLAISRIQSIKK